MNQPLRSRLKVAASAFASNAVNDNLRRAQLSYFAAWTAECAFPVALGIVAYRNGGATAVGLVGLMRMLPSAVVAPLATPLADRGRRERVLVLVSSIRGVATGAAGIVVALEEPVLIVYVLAALSKVAGTLYRPAHSALLPSLCRTGQELTSANVVRGMLDSVATLAGPLLAAVLVEFTGVAVVFAVAAGASLAAAALLLRLRYDAPPRPPAPRAAPSVRYVRSWWRRHGVASGVLTATSENSTKRLSCSAAYPCFSHYRCRLSNSSRAVWTGP